MRWTADELECAIRDLCARRAWSMKKICAEIRQAICGSSRGPNIFEAMEILGKRECIGRMTVYGIWQMSVGIFPDVTSGGNA